MGDTEKRAQIRRYVESSGIEFRDGSVARETMYVTEPWEAPEWRAPWRSAP